VIRTLAPSIRAAAAALALPLVLVFAPAASAQNPLSEYQTTGKITPCKYTSGQLGGSVPNDVKQYAPDFEQALQDAARAGCGASAPLAPTTTTQTDNSSNATPGTIVVKKPPSPPSLRGDASAGGAGSTSRHLPLVTPQRASAPAPVLALGGLTLLLLVAGGAMTLWRATGRSGSTRHGFSELGLRLGAAGGALGDRLRALRR
jgi:hypothetical protein